MDKQLDRLKNDLDAYISPEPIFTDEDKRKIRMKIKESKEINRPSIKKKSWFPKVIGIAAAAFAIFIIGSLINHFGQMGSNDSSSADMAESSSEYKMNDGKSSKPASLRAKTGVSTNADSTFSDLNMNSELKKTYMDFSASKKESLLNGLPAIDIFKLFIEAGRLNDYPIQYALLNHDSNEKLPFKTEKEYIEFRKTQDGSKLNALYGPIQQGHHQIKLINERRAIIYISEGNEQKAISLIKNNEGIWKISWESIK
ncbi:hypothetical protein [Falsibacillus albus]|uniref:Uncharacterized protein n=1 Tax=Falsibacillus albus TaxID=2478915 RepID=A0A3L7JZL0_9BACI|nr:hypothetical protein [Falsibacillus albus]RLQ96227.1 hypothetical protein D9X91_08035 [Falsibacillus albus]